jgi:hypothetical protein
MKGSDVVRYLGFCPTTGYRILKHWEKEDVLTPVLLPALKGLRYRRDEVEQLAKNKEKTETVKSFLTNERKK